MTGAVAPEGSHRSRPNLFPPSFFGRNLRSNRRGIHPYLAAFLFVVTLFVVAWVALVAFVIAPLLVVGVILALGGAIIGIGVRGTHGFILGGLLAAVGVIVILVVTFHFAGV